MIVIKIVGFGILATIVTVILKEQNKEIALILVIVSCVMLMYLSINYLKPIITLINDLVNKTAIEKSYFILILKITGIAYLIEFGKDICKDAGQSAIANKMEIVGKIIIVSLSIPLIVSVLETVEKLV